LARTETLALGVQLARVAEYLHGFDPPILHRDLKPANVLVTPGERVYVVDFGAVRDHLPHEMLHPSGPTIVGTRGYMPIEQFEGRAVPGSDLYALGATLVFALSGRARARQEDCGSTSAPSRPRPVRRLLGRRQARLARAAVAAEVRDSSGSSPAWRRRVVGLLAPAT
jgi:serine/threonine protein kinase